MSGGVVSGCVSGAVVRARRREGGVVKVAVIGRGAIGGTVANALAAGAVGGAELLGAPGRDGESASDLAAALREADLVVECAGQRALAEHGPAVLAAGQDLLVVSVGALADPAVFAALTAPSTGRVYLSTGAVGGLDLLAAAARLGPLRAVCVTTTKRAASLVQPWMDASAADHLRTATSAVELANGPAREVTTAFPKSANVAASVALAVRDWDVVRAVVVADPHATRTTHVITADGPAGSYRFEVANLPSAETPTTSAVVPFAVLHAIEALAARGAVFR